MDASANVEAAEDVQSLSGSYPPKPITLALLSLLGHAGAATPQPEPSAPTPCQRGAELR